MDLFFKVIDLPKCQGHWKKAAISSISLGSLKPVSIYWQLYFRIFVKNLSQMLTDSYLTHPSPFIFFSQFIRLQLWLYKSYSENNTNEMQMAQCAMRSLFSNLHIFVPVLISTVFSVNRFFSSGIFFPKQIEEDQKNDRISSHTLHVAQELVLHF